MRRRIAVCAAIMLFFLGVVIISYPFINGERLEKQSEEAVQSFIETKASEQQSSIPYPELYEAMRGYNNTIYVEHQENLDEPWDYTEPSFNLEEYGIEDGVIAVLNIPAIELSMPVYLGASYENMAAGAAHLSQTSLPTGGENTNCVIAGHRGWNGADYFKHLDRLNEGDAVQLVTVWDTLDYTVSEIKVIEPYDVEQILIQEGRELLTLLTCHPYASGGRYRYLVFCERLNESL